MHNRSHERFADLSLDAWIRYVFDHPVADPAWHFDIDAPDRELTAARSAELIADTFERSSELLLPFTDAQLNQEFWLLVSSGSSDYMFCLTDAAAPLPSASVPCARSSRCFARAWRRALRPRCRTSPNPEER